jgi:uroporphyrinogen decarboxylase
MPKPSMSSRQRVLKALNHEEPDRVPFNLSLTVDVYHRLRSHLGLPPDPDKPTGIWTEVSSSPDLLEAMKVDFYHVKLKPPSRSHSMGSREDLVFDEWGIGRKKIAREGGSYYYEIVKHPLAEATLQDVERYPWPDPFDSARTEGLRDEVLNIRQETDRAIIAKFANSIWEQSWWLYGMQSWLENLILAPEVPCAIMDKVCDVAVGLIDVGLEAVGDLVDVVRLSGEDLGTQSGPLISPQLFNQLVRPRFERLWRRGKSKLLQRNSAGKLMLHSCGSVRSFVPDWIQMGLDILDPIQPRAAGMEPENLKGDFGRQLVFHGGIDIQRVLPFGSPSEVMEEVRRYIRVMGPGGGYIVAPAHNVQSDVPPANLVAMRDAIEAYGYYPLPR